MKNSYLFLIAAIVCSLIAIGYALFLYFRSKKYELEDEKMLETLQTLEDLEEVEALEK